MQQDHLAIQWTITLIFENLAKSLWYIYILLHLDIDVPQNLLHHCTTDLVRGDFCCKQESHLAPSLWYSQSHLGWHFRKLKAQSSKLESLVCHISGKRDVRDMSFELWNSNRKCHPKSMKEPRKMSLQVEFAVCIVFIELRIGGTSISSCNKQESATSKKVTSLLDLIQPIADRVARISRLFLKPFQRTRILPMGFTISTN